MMDETTKAVDPDARARLDWIEKAAIENMKTHHVCADNLAKEAATTLVVLLAGMGGGLAYAAKAIDASALSWFAVGATAFTAWLLVVTWYLVAKCLMITELPQIYNTPENLDAPELTFDALRESELVGLQIRITQAGERNEMLGVRLNRARMLAVASPLVFIAFSAGWAAVGPAAVKVFAA